MEAFSLYGTDCLARFNRKKNGPTYGLTKNIDSFNPVRIAFREWGDMFRQAWRSGSIRNGISYLLRPPGWSHDGNGKTVNEMRKEESKLKS